MRRAKGEGSLLRIYGKKDPVTGEKKLVSQNWFAQYTDADGRTRKVSTGTSMKQKAGAFLRKRIEESANGTVSVMDARKVTYADLRAGLLASYVERGNRSLVARADGEETITGLPQLDAFFAFSATNHGPSALRITTDIGRAFVKARQSETPPAGNAVINRSLACLRRMLKIAHEDGKLQRLPIIRLLKEPPARKGFLERPKFEELLSHLPSHLRPLVTFLYYTGVRVGEALSFEWEQIDLDRRILRLYEDNTKNKEADLVPLPHALVNMLRTQSKTERVFDATNLRKEWIEACVTSGLGVTIEVEDKPYDPKYKGLTVHDLRRSAVRNLIDAGVPESRAMKISRHKTHSTFIRYAIASEGDLVNAMDKVESVSESEVKVGAFSRLELKAKIRRAKPLALSSRG